MAVPATITVTSLSKPELTRRKKRYFYGIQMADPGAPTYVTGGIPINLTSSKVINKGGWERATWDSPALPANSEITPDGNNTSGYLLELQQAAANPTMANFVLRIFTAPGTELGNGVAIPASLFAAAIANAPILQFVLRSNNWI